MKKLILGSFLAALALFAWGFVVLAALAGAFMARLGDAVWWHQSWG